LRDFKVSLAENYFLCLDNLDSAVKPDFLNALCVAATGGQITSRKLYTDREEIRTNPHIFIVLTSREPDFRRDDLVDRLLIFNTEKVENPKSRSVQLKEISNKRDPLWEEILSNLKEIVKLLALKKDWNPECIFRIADWELFGRKVHSEGGAGYFVGLLAKMNQEKVKFSLEDDEVYLVLKYICHERGERIEEVNGNELYRRLFEVAENLNLNSFRSRYRNSKSLCRRLANIKVELKDEFEVDIKPGRANLLIYSFSKKAEVKGG
jgi:hypothetical protein